MSSMLGLRTEPSLPSLKSATAHSARPEQPTPLEQSTVGALRQFLIPPNAHGLPPSLISRQLAQRHHFLGITPDDEASYFCLNPEHASQNATKVLSTLHELAEWPTDQDDSSRTVLYSTDGEDLLAHVIIDSPDFPIQFVCIWQLPDKAEPSEKAGWRYLDVKPYRESGISDYGPLEQAVHAMSNSQPPSTLVREASANSIADDYWSRYDVGAAAAPKGRAHLLQSAFARNDSHAGFSQGSGSPRREQAYWDMYGHDSEEDDEADEPPSMSVPAPARGFGPTAFNGRFDVFGHREGFTPPMAWNGRSSRVSPGDLAEALAMHLQPDLAPSTDVAQGLAVDLGTPPIKETTGAEVIPDPASPIDQASSVSDGSRDKDVQVPLESKEASSGDKAVIDATKALFSLWRTSQPAHPSLFRSTSEERDAFLALVSQAVTDI